MFDSSKHWTAALTEARAAASEMRFDEAISLAQQCADEFSHDRDARGWALFTLFCLILQHAGAEDASHLAIEIMQLNSNIGSKLHVLSVCLDNYHRTDQIEAATSLVNAAGASIEKWKSGDANEDDFSINLAITVIHQCARLKIDHPQFKFVSLEKIDDILAKLAPCYYEKRVPFMYNELPYRLDALIRSRPNSSSLILKTIENVSIVRCGKFAVAFDKNDNLVHMNYDYFPEMFVKAVRDFKNRIKSEIFVSGTSMSMLDEFNHDVNFCHWMVDYLPRVLLAKQLGIKFINIVGPAPLDYNFQIRSLEDLLVGREYVSINSGQVYFFERLVFADNFASKLNHPLFGGHSLLRDEVRNLFPLRSSNYNSLLYVPRKFSRRVINNDDLWNLLSARGFYQIDTDILSLDEQVAAFQAATHIVAPHGAALTSLMFCNAGTEVLELFPKFGGSSAFYVISMISQLNYSCYFEAHSKTHGTQETVDVFVNEAPIYVDINFVSNWLDALGI